MASFTYLLGNGPVSDETARLDHQHTFFRNLAGGLLPRSISEYLSTLSSPQIADVGAGTGSWLLDLAAQLPPNSRFCGFDIDTAKYPPQQELPENVSLIFGNALEPFPEQHRGLYDLVHVRLMMYALRKDEWEAMSRNLATLLKPNGWLLWEETGYISWVSLPPSKAFNDILDLDIRFAQKIGRDITHPAKLLSHVQNSGFLDCDEKDHTNFELFATKGAKMIYLQVLLQAMSGIVANGGMPGLSTSDDVEKLRQAAEAELDSGTLFGMQLKWVWGRKK